MKCVLILLLILYGFNFSCAQKASPDYSYIITTKRIIVKNEKNPTDDSSIYIMPIVSDKYPELKKALCDTNLFEGQQIDSVVNQYKTQGIGYTYFAYDITYANKDIISLQLYHETMGAYPDNGQQWLTLNIHTGKAYPLGQEINATGLKWIFDNYKALMKGRIAADKEARLTDDQSSTEQEENKNLYNDLDQSINSLDSAELLKSYVFTDMGLIFITEPTLPHAVRDREPDRTWLIPYKKLKPYILSSAIVLKK